MDKMHETLFFQDGEREREIYPERERYLERERERRVTIRVLAHFCLGRISSLHGTFVACRLLATSVGSCIFGSGGVVDAS